MKIIIRKYVFAISKERFMKFFRFLAVFLLLLVASTVAAQDAEPLTETYIDDSITFHYPEGWGVESSGDGFMFVSNNAGESKSLDIAVSFMPPTASGNAPSPSDLITDAVASQEEYSDPQFMEIAGKTTALATFSESGSGFNGVTYAVDLGDGFSVMLIAITPGNVGKWMGTIEAIIASMQPGTNSENVEFISADGTFSLHHPADWAALEITGVGMAIASDEELLSANFGESNLSEDSIMVITYPASTTMPDYPSDVPLWPEEIVRLSLSEDCRNCGWTSVGPFSELNIVGIRGFEGYASRHNYDIATISVDMNNGTVTTFIIFTAPGEMERHIDTVYDIVASAVSYVPIRAAPKEINAVYTTNDGSFIAYYPSEWIAQETSTNGNVTVFITPTEHVASDIDSIVSGDLKIMVWQNFETMSELANYPLGLTSDTGAVSIISYFASMGFIQGYEQFGAMDIMEIDGRDASASWATNGQHERLIMVIETDDGDFITLTAYTAPGWMEYYRTLLEMILAQAEQ
jgi:hypothetical protein